MSRRAPTVSAALGFRAKAAALQSARALADLAGRECRRFPRTPATVERVVLAESVSPLWTGDAAQDAREHGLTAGKVQNLRVALRRLDGVVVPANRTFGFWAHVGRPVRRNGFVVGRELREGCVIPTVGGGLCQLSNALYDAALRSGFTIVERHAHTAVVPGSSASAGRDATVFWNYVDLRFRPDRDVRIDATLTADALIVRFTSIDAAVPAVRAVPSVQVPAVALRAQVEDCVTCGMTECFRHTRGLSGAPAAARTAFLLDEYWPEFDAYLRENATPADVAFVPLDGARFGKSNYAWSAHSCGTIFESRRLTLVRALRSRHLAEQGAARQRIQLAAARGLADSYAARLPAGVTHLVVMQHLLPALWAGGHLGGRTFDVLMTGSSMRDLQAALDAAHRAHPESPTLSDFRADPRLIAAEEDALQAARRIITPHSEVARRYGARAVRLPWVLPPAPEQQADARVRPDGEPRTIAFPASTLGRKGAYEVRALAQALNLHVLVLGAELEGEGFWRDVSVERGAALAPSFDRASAFLLPAFVEHRPRRLLAAAARGIPVLASPSCGLTGVTGITTADPSDPRALETALRRLLGINS